METTQDEVRGYVLLIEWDGAKPPTRWYTTLAKQGLHVAGEKDTSPITRRAANVGVVFQEGTIIVNSDSLARRLASHAREMGALTVMVGILDVKNFQMSEQDKATMNKITAITSKRGPKSHEAEGRYIVHCFEESATHVCDLREQPVSCPECGSIRIQWWRGNPRKVATFDPQKHDLIKYWLATRFDEKGRFEVPLTYSNSKLPEVPDTNTFNPDTQAQIEKVTGFVAKYAEDIDGDGKGIIRAMDVAYNLQHLSDEARLNRRINALREFYAAGNSKDYPMAVNPSQIDMVDVAGSDAVFIKNL